jgi:hypothetical protein
MKKKSVILPILSIFLLIVPSGIQADQISKNSVILKEVKEVKTAEDVVFAKESIYVGGISGNNFADDSNGQGGAVTLRELRAPKGVFTLSGGLKIEVEVIPTVARKRQNGAWSAAMGKWDFKYGETNNYKSAIHVKMGGDLDIVYQSTEMKIGEQDHVMHYGLSGNPHAVILSKKRLKKAFAFEKFTAKTKPILSYQPGDDVILVQMEVTSEGLMFSPILDYQVAQP